MWKFFQQYWHFRKYLYWHKSNLGYIVTSVCADLPSLVMSPDKPPMSWKVLSFSVLEPPWDIYSPRPQDFQAFQTGNNLHNNVYSDTIPWHQSPVEIPGKSGNCICVTIDEFVPALLFQISSSHSQDPRHQNPNPKWCIKCTKFKFERFAYRQVYALHWLRKLIHKRENKFFLKFIE